MKPYSVDPDKLADVKPDTTIVLEPAVEAAVSVPGGAEILPGVLGKPVVLTDGVPVATVKPDGNVTCIFETLVGVVFSLKVTSMSLPEEALIPSLPSLTEVWVNCAAFAKAGINRAATRSRAAAKKRLFLNWVKIVSVIGSFFIFNYCPYRNL